MGGAGFTEYSGARLGALCGFDKVGGGLRRGAALVLRIAAGLVRGTGHFGPGDAHALLTQILDQLALRGVNDRRGRFMLSVEPHRHAFVAARHRDVRSEEHTSELQSLMRISYAFFCFKKKKTK